MDQIIAELNAVVARLDDSGSRDRLRSALQQALDRLAASAGSADEEAGENDWHGIIGVSRPMLAMRSLIERFAKADAPVLIHGESGTGKELVAGCLHRLGPRGDKPFVAENCSAIPENLLESTLFGHVKGAFTGAVRDHPGTFVAAHGGTLFLDEIGDMPPAMQAKLLRALQEGEVRPVGGDRVRKVDVRVVAASHRDLPSMVREGSFREDLLYRLAVLRVDVPPLRDREADIVLLAEQFLARAAAGRDLALDDATREALAAYDWPGNVRQLQNEMQRLATLADGPYVTPADLSPAVRR